MSNNITFCRDFFSLLVSCTLFLTSFPQIISLVVLLTSNLILISHPTISWIIQGEEKIRKKNGRMVQGGGGKRKKKGKPEVSQNSLKLLNLKCAIKKCHHLHCSRYFEYISSQKCINLRNSYCLIKVLNTSQDLLLYFKNLLQIKHLI